MTEAQPQGIITCTNCESVYRSSEAGRACTNCGAPLESSDWIDVSCEPTYIGMMSFLKPVSDIVTKAYEGTDMLANVGGKPLKERVEGPVMCGWCRKAYDSRPTSPNCESCGGVLPNPPGSDPGPPPPAPPRRLPPVFLNHLYGKQNFGGWIGVALIVVGIPASLVLIGIPMILIGAVIAYSNFATARRRHLALAKGIHVPGQIEKVERFGDSKQGGYSQLFRVWFRFNTNSDAWLGMKYTYDPGITNHFQGEPTWVV